MWVVSVGALVGAEGACGAALARPLCDQNAVTCTETWTPYTYGWRYTAHGEPSVLFYSPTPGWGNDQTYALTLPQDPSIPPHQSGTGATDNFQLHPAFWLGMAMCDDQSAPNPGGSALAGPPVTCRPDSNFNAFTGTQPGQPRYIGQHPGGAYMEMQFYPSGWVQWPPGDSCSATTWCAALNIDSYDANLNTGVTNNVACLNSGGCGAGQRRLHHPQRSRAGAGQPRLCHSGHLHARTPDPSQDLMMSSGDRLLVSLHDTPQGFQVVRS